MFGFAKLGLALYDASKPIEEKPSTLFKRPYSVVSTINRNFRVAVEKSSQHSHYHYVGQSNYQYPMNNLYVDTADVLARNMRASGLDVLDIGTGNGAFIRENQKKYPKSRFVGITAAEMRTKAQREEDDGLRLNLLSDEMSHHIHVYQKGNAEYLTKIFPEKQFNVICSFSTFMHFADPVGAIREAYDRLKPGGVLIIDKFFIEGCTDQLQAIIDYLKLDGYKIVGLTNGRYITNFIIQKTDTKPTLEFPVDYDERERSLADKERYPVKYRLTKDITKVVSKVELSIYQQGVALIKERIKECKFDDELTKCASYKELLLNNKFHQLPADKQHLLIMNVASITTTYDQQIKRMEEIYQESNKGFANGEALRAYIKQGTSGFRMFEDAPNYEVIDQLDDITLQEKCLYAVAVESIIALARGEAMKVDLANLKVPAFTREPTEPAPKIQLKQLVEHYKKEGLKSSGPAIVLK